MLQALILCLSFFTCLVLFISITLSHTSNINNSFRIIVFKINIIKDSIVKIYINKTHIITTSLSYSSILIERNQSGTKFNANRQASRANHNFLGLLSLETIFWHKSCFRSNFITYFLSLISIQKTIKYKRYHDLIKNVLSLIEFRTNCMAER